jgi:hypothetical protein
MTPALKVAEQVSQHVPVSVISPKADKVLFNYYVGRIHLYFHQFDQAEHHLLEAFQQCLGLGKNKR